MHAQSPAAQHTLTHHGPQPTRVLSLHTAAPNQPSVNPPPSSEGNHPESLRVRPAVNALRRSVGGETDSAPARPPAPAASGRHEGLTAG